MAHEISITSTGQAEAYFANRPAWHNLGTVVTGARTSAEAIELAHLSWNVEQRTLHLQDGTSVDSHRALVRADSGTVLGVAGKDYGIVQNAQAFAILDELAQDGLVRYESAMALRGGRTVILLARLPGDGTVTPTDTVERYVMLATSHDGTRSLQILPTAVRVVCANTWRLALRSDTANQLIALRHTSGIIQRASQAVAVLGKLNAAFDGDLSAARAMVDRKLDEQAFAAFLDAVLPPPEPNATARTRNHADHARSAVADLFYHGALNNLPDSRRSAWSAFNAVTEYIDHHAKLRQSGPDVTESAFTTKLLGSGHELKAKAWDKAVSLTR